MLSPRRGRVAAAALLSLTLLAACGSGDDASPTAEPAGNVDAATGGASNGSPRPSTPMQIDNVNLLSASGATPNLVLFAKDVATTGGFAEKNGIDITIKQSPSAQAIAALMSGSEHFSMTAFSATATAVAKGVPLKIVGSYALEVPGAIVATNDINTFKDLEGKNIVAAALGNTSQINVTAYAQATGQADPGKLKFVAAGNTANTIQYLAAGRGDAAWIQIDSIDTLLKSNPNLHVLVSAEDLSKAVGTIGGVVVVTDEYAKSNGPVIVKVMKSLIESARALDSDQKYFLEKVKGVFPPNTYTDDQLKSLYPQLKLTYAVNGGMDKALIDKSYQAWATYFDPDSASKVASGEDIVDPNFVAQALKELGGPVDHPVDSGDLARG